jgi:hypothetical protein
MRASKNPLVWLVDGNAKEQNWFQGIQPGPAWELAAFRRRREGEPNGKAPPAAASFSIGLSQTFWLPCIFFHNGPESLTAGSCPQEVCNSKMILATRDGAAPARGLGEAPTVTISQFMHSASNVSAFLQMPGPPPPSRQSTRTLSPRLRFPVVIGGDALTSEKNTTIAWMNHRSAFRRHYLSGKPMPAALGSAREGIKLSLLAS